MALIMRDGDFVPDGKGGFLRCEGSREVLERVLWKLSVRRGSFPFLPELGSRLHLLGRFPERERRTLAEQYVKEALSDEDVAVESVTLSPAEEGNSVLTVSLLWQGETLTATVEVGGLT